MNKKAIIHYSSSKEAMEARMSVRPIIENQKLRVIILLQNSCGGKNNIIKN